MDAITLNAVISKDRQLIVELPDDLPEGPVRLVIQPIATPDKVAKEITRGELQAQLAAAGLLANLSELEIPDDLEEVTEEDLEELDHMITIPLNIDALIDEERGDY